MSTSHLSLKPRVSEQTFAMSEDGVYVFEVPTSATKQEIKAAVQDQFSVTVKKINTSKLKGKKMPSARRRQQPVYGARRSIKKAYITLQSGDAITMFEDAS